MTEITVDADAISGELKERPQWLLWDASAESPRRPHWRGDFSVSWTDPDDWHTFEEAIAAVGEVDSWGLGFVFSKGNDDYPRGLYSALDLDGCVNERGGPKDWLPELEPFNGETYMEYSPSGEGIHIPLVGIDVPEWWSNVHFTQDEHEGVEFYDKKFFTFTGDALETSTDEIGDIPQDDVEEWLATVYESITGDDPRELHTPSEPAPEPRETQKSREELADIETTDDYEDILDAVDHLTPGDLPLRSSKTEDENSEYESWDPGYRSSRSGKSLKRHKSSGVFFDMSNPSGQSSYDGFGVLDIFAAEQGITRRPWDRLQGDDFKEAVDSARDAGANIPEFIGSSGDLPEEAKAVDSADLDAETVWELWAEARQTLEVDETSRIPELALWHIAREHTLYNLDALPEDADELPPKAHNRALWWLENRWPEQVELPLDDDESVTARSYKQRDEAIFTWEDVRYIYGGGEGGTDKDGGRYAAVQLLRGKYHFATPEDTERLHLYDPEVGVYEPTAELIVDRELDANLGRYYSQHEKNEILGRLKAGTYRPRADFEAGTQAGVYLCVDNGVIDLDERELLPHDPEYLFTSFLPVEYDPDVEADRIGEFLDEVTRREADKLTMLEMVGNCFLPSYDYESFMVLFGEGSNGKSTFYEAVRRLLGIDNVSSMTLQTLSDNRFAASNLLGKYANIGEDLPEKKITDMGTLKDLTGGGTTWVEEKGKQGFDMRNRAKLMFAANRPPVLGEKSEAVKRRLLPIRLPYQFVPDPDPDDPTQKPAVKEGLVAQLTTDEELSALLNMALDGLDRLREHGDFSLPESNDERLEYYEQFSDPIKEFAINCLSNEQGKGKRIKKDTVYNAYTDFCRQNDYESSVSSVFWRQLRRTVLNVSIVRPAADADGRRIQYLDDTTFTDSGLKYCDEENPVVDTDPDPDDEIPDVDPTPISELSPGYAALTATVKQIDTDTPEPAPDVTGTLIDATQPVDFVEWRGEFQGDLEAGESYRFDNAKIGYDPDGALQVELVPQVTEINAISAGVGTTTPDPDDDSPADASQSSLDASAGSSDDAGEPAATDGGEAATGNPETESESESDSAAAAGESVVKDTDGIEDAEDPKADAARLQRIVIDNGGRIERGALFAKAADQYDIDPDRAEYALKKALRKGQLSDVGGGLIQTV